MSVRFIHITGTDTGVGKTFLAACLARHLHRTGHAVIPLKPLASGGREDAVALCEAVGETLSLDLINPWHFKRAEAPLLAARSEGRRVSRKQIVQHVHRMGRGQDVVLIEGAGGLLSPLGEGFDQRDLIAAIRGQVIVVCPNRLGAVNQVRLVWDALPGPVRRNAFVVLMGIARADASSRTNAAMLGESIPPGRIFQIPFFKANRRQLPVSIRRLAEALLKIDHGR